MNEAGLIYVDRLRHVLGVAYVEPQYERVVVRPGSTVEIEDVLRIAREVEANVGVGVLRGIALELKRMHSVLHLDETSLLVHVQTGITMRALGDFLAARGLTYGPLPPPSLDRSLGALLSAPRASEAAPQRGRFVASCVALSAVLSDGSEVHTRVAPRKATGPDLMHAFIGTHGTIGIMTTTTLRVQRRQECQIDAAFRLPSVRAAIKASRALLVAGGRPTDLQVTGDGTLWLHIHGPEPLAHAERALAEEIARLHQGTPCPATPPPLYRAPCHERAVSLDELERVNVTHKVREKMRISGWHVAGAAVLQLDRAPTVPTAPPLLTALKRRLDPDGRLPAWPTPPTAPSAPPSCGGGPLTGELAHA
jgi:FAD/FMN-containing dehydrogenase